MTRIAIVKKDECQGGRDCPYTCQRFCPRVRTGDETVTVGEDGKPVIHEELCVGCGICVNKCPHDAIIIVNLPEELRAEPVHRFGINGFRLFRLPVPKRGSVVGLLGPNGIGKSTAIAILGGQLIPDLGTGEPADWDAIAEFFAGNEILNYLQELREGPVNLAFKPQQITAIPEVYKGKSARELLEKIDQAGRMDELVKAFELTDLLDHPVQKLSGGEMQRVSIAGCLCRDAEFFFLDEPSSFLDIKQRLNVAKVIRDLATQDKAVMVVEHDLVILDYLTDFTHVMYGKAAAFGVVSLLRGARAGINTYLGGYLKEENVRFRTGPITFEVRAPIPERDAETLVSFEGLKRSFSSFSLDVPRGNIFRGEVVGILGPNGIGKTTMVKMLAGIEEPDEGSVDTTVRVSYKPQYLSAKGNATVQSTLKAVSSDFGSGLYQTEVLRPLSLESLLTKRIAHLSGGELQRLAIAVCLSREADLYLLDEPAAYLDVEQRINAARVIRRTMERREASCMVVDHDILFLDYLSNRLMVFIGRPGVSGKAVGPMAMREGMNLFLKDVGVTFRRDPETRRPRANKAASLKDREQKAQGEYYYLE